MKIRPDEIDLVIAEIVPDGPGSYSTREILENAAKLILEARRQRDEAKRMNFLNPSY